jgi:2-methylisocitrate lyase-like PEP mutase family enzyme
MPSLAEKRAAFRRLHESGCFVIPNPWDIGTARYLQHLGFKALATTSAGAAFSLGKPDNEMLTRDEMLAHIRTVVEASDLPVNADFEAGYAKSTAELVENVRLCVETGVAGLSIEDNTGRRDKPLYDLGDAVDRIRAARKAIDWTGADVMLVGRAECYLVGNPDLQETVDRLVAYAQAGADCLYAPGIRSRDEIAAVVLAVAPKPVNVLMAHASDLTVADLATLGVRRISVGSAMARAAWGGFIRAARSISEQGRFDGFADAAPHSELNKFFREDFKRRSS